ncbi:DNA-directed RNA polymerase II subunit RPB1 [Liparis tanakae]|uniref:DNA-directed RNA polymerase II subunit RPB1 n=1 Tax=Liparis tanakae TaxID=230148 RepID=A0A4Z2FCH4_9TELE|nr:DNA-directed RNA polymerase II subunit RPB1 [Liparis tanakae]
MKDSLGGFYLRLRYLRRRDVCVTDVSVDVLNLVQLSLRHLNKLRPPQQVSTAAERSVPPQRSVHPSLKIPPSLPKVPPSLPKVPPSLPKVPPSLPKVPPSLPKVPPSLPKVPPSLPKVPPSLPKVPPSLPKGAGVWVDFWGTWRRPFLFLIPVLLQREKAEADA